MTSTLDCPAITGDASEMTSSENSKTLGAAIDGVIEALAGLDQKSQITAIDAATQHLGLSVPAFAQKPASTIVKDETASAAASHSNSVSDIRTLKETKEPSTANEMACIVAHYLESHAPADERKDRVTVADMDKYFRQAGFPLPKAQQQILHNAKASGYFDSLGGGAFKLNPVGYNLVVHSLPRQSALGATPKKTRPNKNNKRTVKKSAKRDPKPSKK